MNEHESTKYIPNDEAEIDKVVGDHLSEKQLRRILDELRDEGKIKTQGQRNYMYYMLGDAPDEARSE